MNTKLRRNAAMMYFIDSKMNQQQANVDPDSWLVLLRA